MLIEVSDDEFDFILASLRLYERLATVRSIPAEIEAIATDHGQDAPTPKRIDRLCERLNGGGK